MNKHRHYLSENQPALDWMFFAVIGIPVALAIIACTILLAYL